MKRYYNFNSVMRATVDRALEESENQSLPEEIRKRLEQLQTVCEAKLKEERGKYKCVYSPQRDETFKKMEEKAVALGEHWTMNVQVTYMEEGDLEAQIIMSGNIAYMPETDQKWKEDFCWLITTADSCVIEAQGELFLLIFNLDIYDKVPNTEQTPEA